MNTKLTLRLDDRLIRTAKEYSARTGKSLSRMVADLFEIIKNEKSGKDSSVSPTVSSLRGVFKHGEVAEKDYKRYLEEKYL
ncbi:MAG: antitoxin [Deltaproteobacteria bacterium]|nr:antitoxin [Deltaproteobacteria bacterium]